MPHSHNIVYEKYVRSLLIPPSLNLGSAKFRIGDINVDINKKERPDIVFDLGRFPYPFKRRAFNSVILHHSLEHLDNPKKVIEECSGLLNKGGRIVIVVPSPANKNYGMRDHKSFFTKKSLLSILENNFNRVRVFGYRGNTKNIPPFIGRVFGLISPNQYICMGEAR